MSDADDVAIDLLIELFGWLDGIRDDHVRFKALSILRFHRGEDIPTWDDFRAGVER